MSTQKGVIHVFGFKLGKAVCLLAVWRSFFLVGLQDLSTLVSPRMTVWSWSIPSTAPRRLFYSHSAKGCYEDAVSSALMGKSPVMHTINSMSHRSNTERWEDRNVGSLTWHMSKHVSIHYLQVIPTESQLREPGNVAEHIWRQVLQIVVPQVEFLVQETEGVFVCYLVGPKTKLISKIQ